MRIREEEWKTKIKEKQKKDYCEKRDSLNHKD